MTPVLSLRLRTALAGGVVAALLVTGCGADEPTVESTSFSARLDQIDKSLAEQRFTQARRDLSALETETREAVASGDLDATRGNRILDAITELRATLPAVTPTTPTAPTSTPTGGSGTKGPTSAGSGSGQGENKGKGKGKGHK